MKNQTGTAWLLCIVWITAFSAVVLITLTCEQESTGFHGIAETREIMISSESPVEIRRINVVEGQSVLKGQMLVELVSPELTIRINHISHQLEQLRAQKGVNKGEIRSKIRQLKAEKASRTSEIRNQIRQLENQYNLNKELTSGLKSISGFGEIAQSGASNPITLKIESLRQELALSVKPLNIQTELLQKSLNASGSPIKIQVRQLEKELALLKQENGKLNIYAQIAGIIGSVNFKPREKVAPFAPIVTLHTKNPSFVKGYIHENVYTRMGVGKKVRITSQADSTSRTTGTVVGVGARIVEYPVRLRKNPDIQAWGREVVIRILESNQFILGEKVSICSSEQKTATLLSRLKGIFLPGETYAESRSPELSETSEKKEPDLVSLTPLITEEIEASALLWLEDIDRYMILSDDTPGKKPLVFLMDKQGKITKETSIRGLGKISDMESAAIGDNGTVYIASSLSRNKKGKLGKSRRLLIAAERKGENFKLIRKTDLYALLKKSANRNRNKDWARFVLDGMKNRSVDIEGMFYHAGALHLGFKSPFKSGDSVILKIDRVEEMFRKGKPDDDQISLWKTVSLKADDASPRECISDLFRYNGTLYIAGVSDEKSAGRKSGSIWQMDEHTGKVARIATFDGLRPEGIAAGGEADTLTVSFDQGNGNPSQFAKVKLAL
ncbi:hypothetical protein QUF72_06305 [Desulfobacterales bacterium HSG2]|nr:hypothetical protein [Desulfobacterales bacterium HSG2]